MINGKSVLVVIPARGGSQRLEKKNIYPIWGKPMIYWGLEACHLSKYIDEVIVSTEDEEIRDIVSGLGVKAVDRPANLADALTYKQDAIVDAVNRYAKKYDIVISLQANSPQVRANDLDKALETFIKYDRNELISVGKNLMQNAAFRIMKWNTVFQKTLSTKCGVFVTNYVDIHDLDGVKEAERIGREQNTK